MQAESIDDLIDRSSLGTAGARQFRGRTSAAKVNIVLRKAGLIPHIANRPRSFTMSNPNDRYVVPNPEGGWEVKAAHAKRSSKRTQTQKEAIDFAKRVVHDAGGGEVRIQGRDGRFRDSDTVAPGNDPYPPRDTKH